MSSTLVAPPTYTPAQIEKYFDRILLPRHRYHCTATAGFGFLEELQISQLSTVPFENLDLHYSPHHTVNLDPAHLFEKIVERKAGRGGYCMENNAFFAIVLRSLGFDVTSCGARICNAIEPGADGAAALRYKGWSHMTNIVNLDGQRWMVDVGVGSMGPSGPVPLDEGREISSIAPRKVRLIRDTLPEQKSVDDAEDDRGQKSWIYQHRNDKDQPWISTYSFGEMEFLPQDFEVMSFFTSTSRTSWFTYKVVCGRFLCEGPVIVGDITLFENVVKRRIGGKSEVLMEFKSEQDRIDALRQYFRITLSEAERNGIKGLITEIK